MSMRDDARQIINAALEAALPDTAVKKALETHTFAPGRIRLVAAGKAAWQMAACASRLLGERVESGVVCTKYDHSAGPIANFQIFEGGHPVPDANSFRGTQAAIDLVSGLTAQDTVLFLLSGGGSALFEQPLIPEGDLTELTRQLLACGADIVEMNTLRKRFSAVKGGRFAQLCAPAQVFSIVLSDVLGDPLDMIASGPAYPDSTTCADARAVVEKYDLKLTPQMRELLERETPKHLDNVETQITGSVRQLCDSAARTCRTLGYEPIFLTDRLSCEAREAGSFLAAMARCAPTDRSVAYIAGGETVVRLTGKGLGGRNQEIALSAAAGLAGLEHTLLFSLGSDGTDGPTDAAGGIVDQNTAAALSAKGISIHDVLRDNDAYHALAQADGLIFTGPTGTNVNDLTVLLVRRHAPVKEVPRPRILVAAGPTGAENYEHALRAAGADPFSRFCPPVDTSFDGLLLTGGGDIDPACYGQESRGSMPPDPARDAAELALARAYLEAGKPVLGICRGCQILNVALGGTMVQDLGSEGNWFHRRITADKVHPVHAAEGSLLHRLCGPLFSVNSAHHQAVDQPGEGLVITARSEHGIAEALELPGRPVLGVQFHPERMTGAHLRADTVDGGAIFRWFADQCIHPL